MVWTQLLLVLLNLTIQAEVERTAFRSESQKILLPLAACDSRGTSATFGQNDTRGITSSSVQSRLTGPLGRTESTLEDLPLGQENRTHERLGTLKNALRGPPPSGWVGTRIGSDVYGRYELGSTVAPKKVVAGRDKSGRFTSSSGGHTADAARGIAAHKNYRNTLGGDFQFEFKLPSGKRVDAVDFKNRIVRELKPDNPRAIQDGKRQLERYRLELEKEYGGTWTSFMDTYKP